MVKCGGEKSMENVLLKWSYFYNPNWGFVLYSGWDIFVLCIRVSTVISSGGSGHISAPHVQAEVLDGDKTSVISSILFFLDRSYAIVKSLQVAPTSLATLLYLGKQTLKLDLLPQEISPGVVIPVIDFAWPRALFDHVPENSVFQSTLWWVWQRNTQIWRQRAETEQPCSAARIYHGFNTDQKCPYSNIYQMTTPLNLEFQDNKSSINVLLRFYGGWNTPSVIFSLLLCKCGFKALWAGPSVAVRSITQWALTQNHSCWRLAEKSKKTANFLLYR